MASKNFIVEMWGADKAVVTPERAEILRAFLLDKHRPEYVTFKDIHGREFTVKTEHIIKVKDGRTDLDIMMENAREAMKSGV